ncbi:MAG: transcription-repair coupling factor, partial [Lachnospiraceae bacterium]|nr:transcription-repair coupling factor [Lachnospiraceae bacterium]
MKAFTEPLKELGIFDELKSAVKKEGITDVDGCVDGAKTFLAHALNKNGISVFVTTDDAAARQIAEENLLFTKNVFYYPAKDIIFYQSDLSGNLLTTQRMAAIRALCTHEEGDSLVIVTTFDALMERVPRLSTITDAVMTIRTGDVIDVAEMSKKLVSCGYEKNVEVQVPGQFAVRGGIIDIFPLTDDNPVRIELWGDEADSIRGFDAMSQRSIEKLEEVTVYPATDLIISEDARLEAGIRIREEAEEREAFFRSKMLTEQAHRIKINTAEFLEQLEEYTSAANAASFIPYFFDELVTFTDRFPKDAVFFLDEPARLEEKGKFTELEFSQSMEHRLEGGYILAGQTQILESTESVFAKLSGRRCISFSTIRMRHDCYKERELFSILSRPVPAYNKSFEMLAKDLKKKRRDAFRTVILSPSHTRAKHIADDLTENEVTAFYSEDPERVLQKGEVMTAYGSLGRGFEMPDLSFLVIAETDIFGAGKKKRKRHIRYEGTKIASFTDLVIGDYVVHENFGIGIYRGIEHIEIDGVIRDYVRIEYADNSFVNVIASNLESLQKYASADTDKKVKLHKIGTGEWKKTRQRVKGAVQGVAKKLVELYAERIQEKGYVFSEDTQWQREFEEMFPYEETEDQLRAIEDVKRDMESRRIMDRLICGDVGFGKTEVAIRAAFKAVQEGKQAAFLVPTTILAEQHYNTFIQRMARYPVKVELLCRFRSPARQKKTIQDLKNGTVDIVVGTHRLLSKDVAFKDLGLLVVDEEQRFGVTAKEKIKELRKNVDVLTLTATPIPRTLHMSLVGIRDMSLLEEAPQDRLPIQTFVMEYSDETVREAISREIARNGQVYYVYNRINDIADITARIRELVPGATVEYAHGRMEERRLENIMLDFINGDIDVLVSTTIIETGLDIPNVNTMIIHDSDRMGLAQLYQLRGRVGRSNRTSYAFLMYKRDKLLKETAEKRLAAIREFTDLGSGFRIAMKDLEIRGAGNVLGAEQSGHMEEVGYDLYCRMLDSAIKQEKGEETSPDFSTFLDMDVDAFIPDTYVRNENIKLDLYKRIASIETKEEASDMEDELLDRFGPIPESAKNLIRIALLRSKAHSLFVENMEVRNDHIRLDIFMNAQIDPTAIAPMLESFEGRMSFKTKGRPYFVYEAKGNEKNLIDTADEVLEKMR